MILFLLLLIVAAGLVGIEAHSAIVDASVFSELHANGSAQPPGVHDAHDCAAG